MLIGSIFFSLVLLEVGLRIANIGEPKSTWLVMHDRGYFLNKENGFAKDTFRGRKLRYSFSSLGTRGTEPDTAMRNIFVFGDSFTFGLYLDDHEFFVHHLNTSFSSETDNDIFFANGGIGGAGYGDWLAILQNRVDELPIDGVLIVLNHHDFMRTLARNLFVLSGDSLIASQRWSQRSLKSFLDSLSCWKWLQEHTHIASGIQHVLWTYYHPDLTHNFDPEKTAVLIPDNNQLLPESDYILQLVEAITDDLTALLNSRNIPLWITTTGFIHDDFMTDYDRKVFDHLDEIFDVLNIPFHDITPEFYDRINGDFNSVTIPGDGHPNAEGAALMAELIGAFMMNQLNVSIEDAQ